MISLNYSIDKYVTSHPKKSFVVPVFKRDYYLTLSQLVCRVYESSEKSNAFRQRLEVQN